MSERSVAEYIESVASPDPAPGAGSVAAISGAMGSALGEMVCRISLNSALDLATEPLAAALDGLTICRKRLLELSPQDEQAYAAFRSAQSLPKRTDEEKATRRAEMQTTLRIAAEVPLEISRLCVDALRFMKDVATYGSAYTLADIATGAYLLHAAATGALENVDVNVAMIRDIATKGNLADKSADLRLSRDSGLWMVESVLEERRLPSQPVPPSG